MRHVQGDHEERRERQQIDWEYQELLGAHQLQRDDPEPEVDLEGEVGQPKRGMADNDCQERDQDRRPDDTASRGTLGRQPRQYAAGQKSISLRPRRKAASASHRELAPERVFGVILKLHFICN